MQFGLSNFPPEDVQKVYDIQAAANSVLPTVFQGNYNAVSRHIEGDLFPVLRKLKISFYAYSPIAGGFLVQDRATLEAKSGERRFDPESFLGKMYLSLYGGKSLFEALDVWADIAKDAGLSKAALAYRWIVHHSTLKKEYGDQVIIGSSRFSQVEETLAAVEAGPLDAAIAKRVDDIWETVKHEAPTDNWKDYAAKTPIQV
jgi:aflatoxin B1 aldehyde reductase